MDPHRHSDLNFWQFAGRMTPRSNSKIRERYREHWGESERTRLLLSQAFYRFLSLSLVASNLLLWYMLLGPMAFLFFYIPSFVTNYLVVVDVNYTAHPKNGGTGETKVANLNTRLHHRLGNLLWFGVYFHANHHRWPKFCSIPGRGTGRLPLRLPMRHPCKAGRLRYQAGNWTGRAGLL